MISELRLDPERDGQQRQMQDELLDWVRREAARRSVVLEVHGSRPEKGYLAVPARISNEGWDAVDKAQALQAIEDAWNYPSHTEERPAMKLLLVPTAG